MATLVCMQSEPLSIKAQERVQTTDVVGRNGCHWPIWAGRGATTMDDLTLTVRSSLGYDR
jgi:hypothetical protein